MKRFSLLFYLYSLGAVLLLIYSYTQVDLSLTLSQVSIWQTIQKSLQHIGYFNRPISTIMYIGILAYFFTLYGLGLLAAYRKAITIREFWRITITITAILCFSYPAFSYDLFNHIFTAKTVLLYHKNPYTVTPLAFTGVDPWLSFLHWTHVVSIYSPFWIGMTFIPYLLGFGYFLFIMWNFKIVIALGFLLAVWGIGKALEKNGKHLIGMVIFALNPLVLIESLVSSHNDIVMVGFAAAGIAVWQRQRLWSWVLLSFSIATKIMTVFLVPAFFFRWNKWVSLVVMSFGLLLFLTRREIMPWYFLWILPFVALLPDVFDLVILSIGCSLGLLLRYAPFLYFGHWDPPVPVIKTWATVVPIILAALVVVFRCLNRRKESVS